jgi:hypothetical protein
MLTPLMPMMVERAKATDAWALWKEWTEYQPNGERERDWFVQTAFRDHATCSDMAFETIGGR